jgi:uncharacterized protein (TIGR02444 family)
MAEARRSEKMSNASSGSPFWRFSLAFYRRPGVAESCIALQDDAGVDVNLLMFVLWHATLKRVLSQAQIEALEARVAPWRDATVIPLRTVRRALKSAPELVAPHAAELFRAKIKAVELEAERLQQEAMYDLARGSPLGHEVGAIEEAARANLANYAAMLGKDFPADATKTLLGSLTAFAQADAQADV